MFKLFPDRPLDNLLEQIVKNITQQLFQRYCFNNKLLNNYSEEFIKLHISSLVLFNFFGYAVESSIGRKEETQLEKLNILKQNLNEVEKSNLYKIVNKRLRQCTEKIRKTSTTELSCHDNIHQLKLCPQQSSLPRQKAETEKKGIIAILAMLCRGLTKAISFLCCCISCRSDDSDDVCYPPSPTQNITQTRQLLTNIPSSSNATLQPTRAPTP